MNEECQTFHLAEPSPPLSRTLTLPPVIFHEGNLRCPPVSSTSSISPTIDLISSITLSTLSSCLPRSLPLTPRSTTRIVFSAHSFRSQLRRSTSFPAPLSSQFFKDTSLPLQPLYKHFTPQGLIRHNGFYNHSQHLLLRDGDADETPAEQHGS